MKKIEQLLFLIDNNKNNEDIKFTMEYDSNSTNMNNNLFLEFGKFLMILYLTNNHLNINDIKYKTVTIIFKFLLFDFLDKTRVNVAAIKRNKIITKKGEDEIREKSNFILSKNVISSIIFIFPSFILYLLILQLQQFVYFLSPKYM